MTISMHQACVPVLIRQLTALAGVLDKGEAYAAEAGLDPKDLLDAKLAPDMFPLTRQVQIATDMAKGGAGRLAGVDIPPYADDEQSFADLKARVAKTIAFLESIPDGAADGSEDREIVLKFPNREFSFTGQDYLLNFVLPNVFFHASTAYGLLRKKGVPLTKGDFLGGV